MELLLIFLGGLVLGALLNIVIIRLPREQRLLGWPRCTRTGTPLRFWQLLPLLGWLLQRGRAADGRPLHWIYPFVELLTGGALAWLFWRYGMNAAFAYASFVCLVLIVVGAIDFLHRYIYTFFILGATLLTMVFAPLVGLNWINMLLGALAGGFTFALLFMLAKVLFPGTAAPFGLGDVYLAIFIGAAVGLTNLMAALFYGMLMAGLVAAGILIARRTGRETPTYIAYGSYLCLGTIIYICLGGLR